MVNKRCSNPLIYEPGILLCALRNWQMSLLVFHTLRD